MFDLTKYLTRAVIGVVALIAITIIFGSGTPSISASAELSCATAGSSGSRCPG